MKITLHFTKKEKERLKKLKIKISELKKTIKAAIPKIEVK